MQIVLSGNVPTPEELRAEVAPVAEPAPSPEGLRDWLVLNEILGESRRSVQWFDAQYATATNQSELAEIVDRYIGPLLLARWSSGRRRRRAR